MPNLFELFFIPKSFKPHNIVQSHQTLKLIEAFLTAKPQRGSTAASEQKLSDWQSGGNRNMPKVVV